MGQDYVLTCCRAEMLKSGHTVVLTCWQDPKRVPEQVPWFLLVVVLSRSWGTLERFAPPRAALFGKFTAPVGELAMLPLPNRRIHAQLLGSIFPKFLCLLCLPQDVCDSLYSDQKTLLVLEMVDGPDFASFNLKQAAGTCQHGRFLVCNRVRRHQSQR